MSIFLSILGRYWKEIAISLVIISGFLYVRWLQASREHWKGEYEKAQVTLTLEREGHQRAMDESVERQQRDLSAANEIREAAVAHLQDRVHSISDSASALAERLRLAESRRLRPLAPAASAPAQCRDYSADPVLLDGASREFLIGEATAAEVTAALLQACRKDYEAAKTACGARDGH